MQTAASRAVTFVDGFSKEDFLADQKTQFAVNMCLHVIGEVAGRIVDRQPQFAAAHPEIQFEQMRGMRNRIAHGYFQINLNVVWETVKHDLPGLLQKIDKLDIRTG